MWGITWWCTLNTCLITPISGVFGVILNTLNLSWIVFSELVIELVKLPGNSSLVGSVVQLWC